MALGFATTRTSSMKTNLALLATPLYRGEPLYQTYIAVNENSRGAAFDELGAQSTRSPIRTAPRATL